MIVPTRTTHPARSGRCRPGRAPALGTKARRPEADPSSHRRGHVLFHRDGTTTGQILVRSSAIERANKVEAYRSAGIARRQPWQEGVRE